MFKVGKSGLALTEEQKIRISIARAVLLNPSILLLDEVTNKLDLEQKGLFMRPYGGQCVKMGTHEEMTNSNGLYSEIRKCEELVKLPESKVEGDGEVRVMTKGFGDLVAKLGNKVVMEVLVRCWSDGDVVPTSVLDIAKDKKKGSSSSIVPLESSTTSEPVLDMLKSRQVETEEQKRLVEEEARKREHEVREKEFELQRKKFKFKQIEKMEKGIMFYNILNMYTSVIEFGSASYKDAPGLEKVEEDGEVRMVMRIVYNLVAKVDDGGAWVAAW
ncbi:ABC transporter B family member 20-like protein [Tanacetum coccineum]|uniref:ABC transporter B family member 20-like protein n=1 Tax=Tanacetum coccineum TaxID=301880 RepID=A0ABQ5AFW7_9ASTR